jgi:hypothetical protein
MNWNFLRGWNTKSQPYWSAVRVRHGRNRRPLWLEGLENRALLSGPTTYTLTIASVTTDSATLVLSRDDTTNGAYMLGVVRSYGSAKPQDDPDDWRFGEFYFNDGQSSATWIAVKLKPDKAYEGKAYDSVLETPWVPFRTLKSPETQPPPHAPGSTDSVTVSAKTATTITLQFTRASADGTRTDKLTYKGKVNTHGRRPNLALTFFWRKGQATKGLRISKLASHDTYSFVWKSKGAVLMQVTATTR